MHCLCVEKEKERHRPPIFFKLQQKYCQSGSYDQGEQTGRIFPYWVIIFFGQFKKK
jgi:hypothetical protein